MYDIILSDPPWPQTKGNTRKCRPNQTKQLPYKTISLPEIKAIHETFFKQAAEKHNVFLWAIDKYLHEAESMMRELGYTLHARLIWDKCNGIAPAFTVRFAHEYLLWFYRKGCILMPCESTRGVYSTIIREASSTHSTKPETAFIMLEKMFPDSRKLELFARRRREGWDAWGDEVAFSHYPL